MIKTITNYKGKIVFNQKYPDGVKFRKLDTKILNELGWEPKISLENGLHNYYEYFKKEVYK
jgi:GDP-L-fucose synthase